MPAVRMRWTTGSGPKEENRHKQQMIEPRSTNSGRRWCGYGNDKLRTIQEKEEEERVELEAKNDSDANRQVEAYVSE